MLDETEGPRDVSQLLLPGLGYSVVDEHGAWQVYGPDGSAVSAVTWFLADLSASGLCRFDVVGPTRTTC